MQNKNNRTVKELTDKIAEVSQAKFPSDSAHKWAYRCCVLVSILDFEVKGYANGYQTLQEAINSAYERYDSELKHDLELARSRD